MAIKLLESEIESTILILIKFYDIVAINKFHQCLLYSNNLLYLAAIMKNFGQENKSNRRRKELIFFAKLL